MDLFSHMQATIDLIATSPHPTHKIAAGILGGDFFIARTNFWPNCIEEKLGRNTRIGDASGTIHAEVSALLAAPKTEGATLFVSDPPCPNCMKNMAEAGIKTLYIDHKGFKKDFALKRGHHFEDMSMRIAEHAGIAVYELWRKEERIEVIFEPEDGYVPPEENPVTINPPPLTKWEGALEGEGIDSVSASLPPLSPLPLKKERGRISRILAHDSDKNLLTLTATPHPAIGYTSETLEAPEGKYSFMLEPVNRLLMTARRRGLTLLPHTLESAQCPTSRELVNMIGAGLTQIKIHDPTQARDTHALEALAQLQNAGILKVS